MMIRALRTASSLGLGLATLALLACSGTSSTADTSNDDSNEAASASAQSSHLGSIVFSSVTSQDPAKASSDASVGGGQLWPAGCATRSKDPTNPLVVHVIFNDCTGPFGLLHLNGEEIITFSANTDGTLHAAYASQNLTVNGRPSTHTASADVTVAGNTRTVKWQGAWTRTDAKGETVSHTSNLTLVADLTTQCLDTNGTAQTNVSTREVDSAFKDFKVCRVNGVDACPSGVVTHAHKASGKTLTATFDGTSQAVITEPNGATVKVPLVCGP